MRTAVDQMIDLAKAFTSNIELTKDAAGLYLVSIHRVWSKDSRTSAIKSSISGRSSSVEGACSDFMGKAKGKILMSDDKSFYGGDLPEFICV